MEELCAEIVVRLSLRENETAKQAEDRLYNILYDGLCNNAEHQIDFELIQQNIREINI